MDELLRYLREKGFDFTPETLTEQNSYQEFQTPTRKGWFVASQFVRKDGAPYIIANFGDWRTGEKHTFKSSASLSLAEEKQLDKKAKAQRTLFEEKRLERQSNAAYQANDFWNKLSDKFTPSKYTVKKKIGQSLGTKTVAEPGQAVELIVPMRDMGGTLWGYQTINEDGSKFFCPGQKITGLSHLISGTTDVIYVCEGFATGAAVHMATKASVYCALQASNLEEVALAIRKNNPRATIVIAGDDDVHAPQNVGRTKAVAAAKAALASAVFPRFKNSASKPTDFNDLLILEGLGEITNQLKQHCPVPPSEIITTEDTGFHTVEMVRGKEVFTPCYQDLKKFFERKHAYRVLVPGRMAYIFNGKFYERYSDVQIEGFAQEHFWPTCDNHMAREFLGIILRSNFADLSWFEDTTYKKINFQNGVLDIQTNKFGEHSKDLGFKYVLDYEYDPKATCPNFDKMLSAITVGDTSLQDILLEFAGYCVSNDSCWTQKALVLEGLGSNGKSTLMNVLHALAGRANTTSLTFKDLEGEYNRQTLDGKLLNMAEETPSRSLMDSSLFKNLVTGGSVSVRAIFKDPYTLRSKTKFILSCNNLPESEDTSAAFFRRFLIVPCRAKFDQSHPDFDPFIEEKLLKELPGIFNRVLAAYRNLLNRKRFPDSKAAMETLDDYQRSLNPVIDYVSERVETFAVGNGHDDTFIIFQQLYDDYKAQMERLGHRPLNAKAFGRKLREVIPDYVQRKGSAWVDQRAQKIIKAAKLISDKVH